jgi:hypothetical protein
MLAAVAVLAAPVHAQIKASGAEVPREFGSPMDLEIPIPEHVLRGNAWTTHELKQYVCSGVSIQMLQMTQVRRTKRKGPDKIELGFTVVTFTNPPQDMLATITFAFKNDNEELGDLVTSRNQTKPLQIDAEERKTREASVVLYADREDYHRVLGGPNPRLVIHLEVAPN